MSEWTRWGQLVLGIICMVMIANLQYGWTLFINPIDQKYHWGRAAIQVAFTIFIVTETWVVPFEGYLIDRFGPRVMVCGSGALVAIAWVINSVADSLILLYVAAVIAGIGAGPIFGATVGNALKWFPDRRGLAAGLTAAGFGAGSALTVVPIANMIQSSGYEAAFLWFGLGQGVVVMVVALLLRAPRQAEVAAPVLLPVQQTKRDYAPVGGAQVAAILADVRDVRDGRNRRSDGDGPTRAGRQGFRNRQCPGIDSRTDHAGTQFCVVDRPRAQRLVAAVLRLGVRPDRP